MVGAGQNKLGRGGMEGLSEPLFCSGLTVKLETGNVPYEYVSLFVISTKGREAIHDLFSVCQEDLISLLDYSIVVFCVAKGFCISATPIFFRFYRLSLYLSLVVWGFVSGNLVGDSVGLYHLAQL